MKTCRSLLLKKWRGEWTEVVRYQIGKMKEKGKMKCWIARVSVGKFRLIEWITVPINVDPVEHVRTLPIFLTPSQPSRYVPTVWQPDCTLAPDENISLNAIMKMIKQRSFDVDERFVL